MITDKEKKVLLGFAIPIFLVCFVMLCWLMYYYMFLANKITISTTYLDKASYVEDRTYFMDINYYSNANGNGQEVFEIKFNYYTDTRLPEKDENDKYETKYIYSTGAQFINGIKYDYNDMNSFGSLFTGREVHRYNLTNSYDYDTEMGGQSFASLKRQSLRDQNKWIYDVNGKLCLIQTKGEEYAYNNLWIKSYVDINTSYFILEMYNTVKSLDAGEKVFEINLSEYFFVTLQDEEGFFKTEPTDDINYTYANIHINVNPNGMINSDQSMFGIVENKSDWSMYGDSTEMYWQVRSLYQLTQNDFIITYHDENYYLMLKSKCKNWLQPFNYIDIYIDINLDAINVGGVPINVKGFDNNLYENLNVYKVTLHSQIERDFEILNDSILVESDELINVSYLQQGVQYA